MEVLEVGGVPSGRVVERCRFCLSIECKLDVNCASKQLESIDPFYKCSRKLSDVLFLEQRDKKVTMSLAFDYSGEQRVELRMVSIDAEYPLEQQFFTEGQVLLNGKVLFTRTCPTEPLARRERFCPVVLSNLSVGQNELCFKVEAGQN